MRSLQELVQYFIDQGVTLNDMTTVLRCVGYSDEAIRAVYEQILPTITYRTKGGVIYMERHE